MFEKVQSYHACKIENTPLVLFSDQYPAHMDIESTQSNTPEDQPYSNKSEKEVDSFEDNTEWIQELHCIFSRTSYLIWSNTRLIDTHRENHTPPPKV